MSWLHGASIHVHNYKVLFYLACTEALNGGVQIICLSDLECDFLNTKQGCKRLNQVCTVIQMLKYKLIYERNHHLPVSVLCG